MLLEEGHEGTMIRDKDSMYEVGQRSNYLLKHKDFQTEEYEIVGANEGTGREKGTVIWVCKTQSGREFTVRPEGTLETRKNYFKNKNNFLGKLLTVKFQNLTSLGIPRFPVGIVIRDYE